MSNNSRWQINISIGKFAPFTVNTARKTVEQNVSQGIRTITGWSLAESAAAARNSATIILPDFVEDNEQGYVMEYTANGQKITLATRYLGKRSKLDGIKVARDLALEYPASFLAIEVLNLGEGWNSEVRNNGLVVLKNARATITFSTEKKEKAFIVFRPYRAASVDGGEDIIKSYQEANEVFRKVLALNRNAPNV